MIGEEKVVDLMAALERSILEAKAARLERQRQALVEGAEVRTVDGYAGPSHRGVLRRISPYNYGDPTRTFWQVECDDGKVRTIASVHLQRIEQ